MAKILQSYAFLVLTDSYGDIPYTEAAKGYTNQVVYPKYDKQQVVYTGIIKDISDAVAALDAAKTRENADVLFGGDVAKWKRFGNSLLLRIGLRLAKVDGLRARFLAKPKARIIVRLLPLKFSKAKSSRNFSEAGSSLCNKVCEDLAIKKSKY
jgi:hypothetical protein